LARSAQEAAEIVQALHSRGAVLRILNLDLDTGTTVGKHLLQVLAAAAEVEQTTTLDKQYEDKQKKINYLSREIKNRVLALENLARVDALRREGLEVEQMARRLELGEPVVRHAWSELRCREAYGDSKLNGELSSLRDRRAALMRD